MRGGRQRSQAGPTGQVAAHDIDNHGDKHHHDANPETPVRMRAFPIWNMTGRSAVAVRIMAMVTMSAHFGFLASCSTLAWELDVWYGVFTLYGD